jgi:FlaA1/EpsC-like NDP-sugar epimerase
MIYVLGFVGQSRAVMVVDWVLVSALVAGSRLSLVWLRHTFALRPRAGDRRVLIVGATDMGELALRLMLHSTHAAYHPAGFLDDDPGKHRRKITGVSVLGTVNDLGAVAKREHADLVVIAGDPDDARRQRVRDTCAELGIEYRELDRVL